MRDMRRGYLWRKTVKRYEQRQADNRIVNLLRESARQIQMQQWRAQGWDR